MWALIFKSDSAGAANARRNSFAALRGMRGPSEHLRETSIAAVAAGAAVGACRCLQHFVHESIGWLRVQCPLGSRLSPLVEFYPPF